jgi:threonine synthase
MLGLRCKDCGETVAAGMQWLCPRCGGRYEPYYKYNTISREKIAGRQLDLWRYLELLPVDQPPGWGERIGWTPLIEVPRLARHLGVEHVYIKWDGGSFPSFSFKDRVVSMALAQFGRFGLSTAACPSTGNLSHSVAALSARAGYRSVVLVPATIEAVKMQAPLVYGATLLQVDGTYDEINRLCQQIPSDWKWGVVNVHLRPYYAEGSKTLAYEIAEQLGWRLPDAIVAPMAGGALVDRLGRGLEELQETGLVQARECRIFGAQAEGCAPIVRAFENGNDVIAQVTPKTVAHSLAIGDPVDGKYAIAAIRRSHGKAVAVSDEALLAGMRQLATIEGIFTETAGGVVIAAAESLDLKKIETLVLVLTGNGLKTMDALRETKQQMFRIKPQLSELEQCKKQANL